MSNEPTVLIVDDDQDAAEWLQYLLQTRFPSAKIEIRLNPDASGTYDIFLIDNDFHGTCLAADLARAIRASNPHALIVAFSAYLDRQTLKQLVNLGCDGACDKSDPNDVERMSQIISAFVERSKKQPAAQSTGFLGAVRSIGDLLRQWNQRLETGHAIIGVPPTAPAPPPASVPKPGS